MPSYFEMLRMAEPGLLSGVTLLDVLRSGGLLLAAAFLCVSAAVLFLPIAFIARDRKWLLVSFGLGIIAMGCGGLASYLGFQNASEVVAAAGTRPTDVELVAAANVMRSTVAVPTTAALGVWVLALAAFPFIRGRVDEADPVGPGG